MTERSRGNLIYATTAFWLLWCVPEVLFAVVTTGSEEWQVKEGNCFYITNNPGYAESLVKLAKAALHRSDNEVGCVTYPYLGQPYDFPDINNIAHAGIDFKANEVPVYAVEGGRVVVKAFDPSNNRSTLIIENNSHTRKVLYLHMSRIDVEKGRNVAANVQIGVAGSIGSCPSQPYGCPHLHIEVWPSTSPIYGEREKAISGSACGGTCGLLQIEAFTDDPVVLILDSCLSKIPQALQELVLRTYPFYRFVINSDYSREDLESAKKDGLICPALASLDIDTDMDQDYAFFIISSSEAPCDSSFCTAVERR